MIYACSIYSSGIPTMYENKHAAKNCRHAIKKQTPTQGV